jgi:hypothetical protein
MRLLGVVAATLGSVVVAAALAGSPSQPNIVFILLDDVGWGDFSFNGCPIQDTPNIHSVAAAGMVLTDTYAASPLCSPSRAAALTGRLPIRNGFYTDTWFGRNGYAGQGVSGAIPDSEVLVQQALQVCIAWFQLEGPVLGFLLHVHRASLPGECYRGGQRRIAVTRVGSHLFVGSECTLYNGTVQRTGQ